MVYRVSAEVNRDAGERTDTTERTNTAPKGPQTLRSDDPLRFLVDLPLSFAAANDDEPFGPPVAARHVGTVKRAHPVLGAVAHLLSADEMRDITACAAKHGTCVLAELVASGRIEERTLYEAVALWLDRPFATVDAARLQTGEGRVPQVGTRLVRVADLDGDGASVFIAPDAEEALRLKVSRRTDGPTICAPSDLARAIERCRSAGAMRDAVHGLYETDPTASARSLTTGWQGFAVSSALWFAFTMLLVAPFAFLLGLHVVLTALFAACVALRMAAARHARVPRYSELPEVNPRDLPVYSVLVALHQEAAVVPQLIDHLDRIRWPRTKLDIRLVCEADDRDTLDAIAAHGLPPHMTVVLTPEGGPRTKPKALNYALDGARGEFVVLYDAEDRPHPNQLLEAWTAFRAGSDDLACLQAPLQIDNGHQSFFSRGFAVEYAALFRGLLPWLAARGLPVPLGGTSNHFRRSALEGVGAWDPYNVTEDADLGFRLSRAGFSTNVLTRPTLEMAPETLQVWVPQRTRWLKGWMQTWLVHMREPRLLWREIGPGGFAVLQLVMLGMVASAMFHPLMLVTIVLTALALVGGIVPDTLGTALLTVDVLNIVLGYGAFYALARSVLLKREQWVLGGSLWRLPLYWLALGIAAHRAAWQLWQRPHLWEKTPHQPSPMPPSRD